jgi:hypothetical protein
MTVQNTYYGLLDRGKTCLDQLVADSDALTALSKSDNYQADFAALAEVLADRPETQVALLAQREYQHGLHALAIANYRHAFISLRLYFELSLAAIEFSAREIRYRQWSARLADIVWAPMVDEESGVFSDAFIRPFNKELAPLGKQYRAIAAKVYRECSEYVHGNLHTHPALSAPLEFNKGTVLSWADKADTMRRCIIFLFAARFLNYLPRKSGNKIEQPILDVLGDVPAVQAY